MNKNLLLIIGYTFVGISILLMVRLMALHFEPWIDFSERDIFTRILIRFGALVIFSLWLWMLFDFFKNGVDRHKVAWGFFLIFFSYFAALIYFFSNYVPRIKKSE